MIVTIVDIYVDEGHLDEFIAATIENHKYSILEPENLRFDLLQSKEDPTRFTLYEVYQTEEASKAHKNTSHYLKWREKAEPWMKKPRVGIAYQVIAPDEEDKWKTIK